MPNFIFSPLVNEEAHCRGSGIGNDVNGGDLMPIKLVADRGVLKTDWFVLKSVIISGGKSD